MLRELRGRPRRPVELPEEIRAEVDAARALQREAIATAQRSTRAWRAVAHRLAGAGVPVNEAARILGVSPARVRDLLDDFP